MFFSGKGVVRDSYRKRDISGGGKGIMFSLLARWALFCSSEST